LLPFYVFDILFIVEVCRQYKYWAHFFNEKRKKQFIPLPWKVGEMFVKNISHLDEYTIQFDHLSLKEVQAIHGFDPKDLFSAHMSLIRYGSYFSKSMQFEEGGGDNQNLPEASLENTLDDIEALDNTNEYYKKWGREETRKNPGSPNVSQKSTRQKQNPKIVVKNREGLPPEIQMMVETKTLPERQLKNHTLFIPILKEKEKSKKKDKNYLKLKRVPKIWKLMT
jgi:hypothetical protein